MTIDPTKDVETEEEHPRPVMMLYALGNDTPYGFVVFNITGPGGEMVAEIIRKALMANALGYGVMVEVK